MTWVSPSILYLLWTVPVFVGVLWAAERSKRKAITRFLDAPMAAQLAPSRSTNRFATKLFLRTIAVILCILALAGPQYGEEVSEVEVSGIDVFILLDVSRSMLAEDVKPNRLARAKSDILDLLRELDGDSVGLITFAGAPVVQVPLTSDGSFFRLVLRGVDCDSAPRGGTFIGEAIRKALSSMEQTTERSQLLVLITDGDDQESFPVEAAQQAADRNIKMITVGLGDIGEGARIPERGEDGSLSFVQYEGQEIWSKMDSELLQEIADVTSGVWVPAQTRAYNLASIYRAQLQGLTSTDETTETKQRKMNRFQWFLIPALLLLACDSLLSVFRRPPTHESQSA
ncbi:MAG: VWA domain-containing protein [Fuerstiella sp.]